MGTGCDHGLTGDGGVGGVGASEGIGVRTVDGDAGFVDRFVLVAPDHVVEVLDQVRLPIPLVKDDDFTTIGQTAQRIDRAGEGGPHVGHGIGRAAIFEKFIGRQIAAEGGGVSGRAGDSEGLPLARRDDGAVRETGMKVVIGTAAGIRAGDDFVVEGAARGEGGVGDVDVRKVDVVGGRVQDLDEFGGGRIVDHLR